MTIKATAKHLFESGYTEAEIEAMGLVGLVDLCRTVNKTPPHGQVEANWMAWRVGSYWRRQDAADEARAKPPLTVVRQMPGANGKVRLVCDECGPIPEMGGAASIVPLYAGPLTARHMATHLNGGGS